MIIFPAIRFLPPRLVLRVSGLALASTAAIAAFHATAPQCIGGAFNTLDPLVREYWLVNVLEGLPIWYQNGSTMITLLGGSIIVGLGSLLFILWSQPARIDRSKLLVLAYAFLWALLLSLFVQRATAVAAAFALPLMAWAVHRAFVAARQIQRPPMRILATAAVVFLIMPGPLVVTIYNGATGTGKEAETKPGKAFCESNQSLATLNRLPRSNLVAPLDFGPPQSARHQPPSQRPCNGGPDQDIYIEPGFRAADTRSAKDSLSRDLRR